MTKDEALALPASHELDAIVGRACGFEPDWWIGASSDGGESWSAIVDRRDGPWYSERELREWLAVEHSQKRFLDYEIVKSERWPKYSESIEAAWQVLPDHPYDIDATLPEAGIDFTFHFTDDKDRMAKGTGETVMLARCRAALKALWKD